MYNTCTVSITILLDNVNIGIKIEASCSGDYFSHYKYTSSLLVISDNHDFANNPRPQACRAQRY